MSSCLKKKKKFKFKILSRFIGAVVITIGFKSAYQTLSLSFSLNFAFQIRQMNHQSEMSGNLLGFLATFLFEFNYPKYRLHRGARGEEGGGNGEEAFSRRERLTDSSKQV